MANINISQIRLKRANTATASTYVGPLGEPLFDTGLKVIRIQDGVTPGGWFANAGGASGGTTDATLAANVGSYYTWANANVSSLQSQITSANVAWQANAVTQQTQLNTLTANAASQSVMITALMADLGTANDNIAVLDANAGVQANQITGANAAIVTANTAMKSYVDAKISNLVNGAPGILDTLNEIATALQNDEGSIATITGGQTAANTQITNLWSNAASQASTLATLQANVGAYHIWANANVAGLYNSITAANVNIATLQGQVYSDSNVATYLSNYNGQINFVGSPAIISGVGTITTANITAGGFFWSNGAPFVTSNYGNANVAAYLPTYTGTFASVNTNSLNFANGAPYVNSGVMASLLQSSGSTQGFYGSSFQDYRNSIGFNTPSYIIGSDISLDTNSGNITLSPLKTYKINFSSLQSDIYNGSGSGAVPLIELIYSGNGSVISSYPIYSKFDLYFDTIFAPGTNANVKFQLHYPSPSGGWTGNIYNPTVTTQVVAGWSPWTTYGNTQVAAYLAANPQGGTYGNANVASYLPTYTGNIAVGNINASNSLAINISDGPHNGTFTFGSTGLFTAPGGINTSSGINMGMGALGQAGNNFTIGAFSNNNIQIQTNYANETWTFQTDGQLVLPQSTQGGIGAGWITSVGNIGFNAQGNLWRFGSDGTMTSPYSVKITTTGIQYSDGTSQSTAYGNANVAAYLVANPQAGTYSNTNVSAYLAGNVTTGNLTIGSALQIHGLDNSLSTTNGSAVQINNRLNVNGIGVGYSIVAAGDIQTSGNVNAGAGKVTAGNIVTTNGLFWANGVSALTSSYGNTQVATYLSNYNGSINFTGSPAIISGLGSLTTGNITTTNGVFWANGVAYSTGGGAVSSLTNGSYSFTLQSQGYLTVPTSTYGTAQMFSTAGVPFYIGTLDSGNYWQLKPSGILQFPDSSQQTTAYPGTGPLTAANTQISNLQANVGSFYTWANTNFGTSSYSNANVASYLPTYSGNVGAGNIVTTGATSGNISGANVISANTFQVSTGIFWANGTAWSSSGGGTIYSNTNVAAYLTTATISTTGNITAGNLIGTQYGNTIGTTATYTGNVTVANIIGTQYGNTVGTTATYTGNITAANIITTGTYGNITNANVISANNVVVSGYGVQMANRPAFRVYGSGVQTIQTTSNVNLKGTTLTVDYNQGSYYNNTTGIFTAPVAGLYQTTLVARVANNNGLNQCGVFKNGSTSGANIIAFWETDTNTGTATHFGTSGVAKLAVGEWLSANIVSGNISFDQNDSWTVTYIG